MTNKYDNSRLGKNIFVIRGIWLLFLLLISLPLFGDVLNGIFGASETSQSFGSIIRGFVILLSLVLIIKDPYNLISLASVFLFSIILLVIVVQLGQQENLSIYVEVSQVAKFLYIPFLSAAIAVLLRYSNYQGVELLLKFTVWGGAILALFVILPAVLGVGDTVYKYASLGNKGILMSQNDVGLGLLLALIIAVYLASTKGWFYFTHVCIIISALFFLGSRTGLVGATIALITMTLSLAMFATVHKHRPPSIIKSSIFSLVLLFFCTVPIFYYIVESSPYLINKILNLRDPGGVRAELLVAGWNTIGNYSSGEILFGRGYLGWIEGVRQSTDALGHSILGRKTEIDWLDIFGYYGLVSLFCVLLCYFTAFFIAFKQVLFNRELVALPCLFGLGVFITHGLLAGHAFMSPLSGTFVAPLIAIVCYKFRFNVLNRQNHPQ
jgi:hypothetical protein